MEALESFLKYLGVGAFRQFGFWGGIAFGVGLACLMIAIRAIGLLWQQRHNIYDAIKRSSWIQFLVFGSIAIVAFSFLFLPSNPFVVAVFVLGFVGMFVPVVRGKLRRTKLLSTYVLVLLLLLNITIGGVLHDLVFPPTALCRDGSYSSSASRRGTCSWHGGVEEWGPGPWWGAILR